MKWSAIAASEPALGEPEKFFTAPGYDGWPLVMLRLAEVDADRLAELVTDAWRMRAPESADTALAAWLLAGDAPDQLVDRVRFRCG
jgi:hypothetical protein